MRVRVGRQRERARSDDPSDHGHASGIVGSPRRSRRRAALREPYAERPRDPSGRCCALRPERARDQPDVALTPLALSVFVRWLVLSRRAVMVVVLVSVAVARITSAVTLARRPGVVVLRVAVAVPWDA